MYWYGVPHPITRDNLATCIWQSRAHAVAANSRPYHAKAARLAATSYEMYTLERYTLRKGAFLWIVAFLVSFLSFLSVLFSIGSRVILDQAILFHSFSSVPPLVPPIFSEDTYLYSTCDVAHALFLID